MYTNWEQVMTEGLEWYPVNAILRYLHALRRYIIRTEGAFSLTYMPKITSNNEAETDSNPTEVQFKLPATKENRFPEDQRYLCEAIGDWNAFKDELELTASILIYHNRLQRQYKNFKTQGEAEQHALDLIQSLLKSIENRTSIFGRREFEDRYGLQWKED